MKSLLLYITLSLIWLPGQARAFELYERPGGPPVVLTPAPETDRPDLAIDHYRKPGGTLLGIGRGIILKMNPELDLQSLLTSHDLMLADRLGPGIVLVKTVDRSLTLDTVNRLNQAEGVIFAHPDYVRRLLPR